MSKTLKCLTIKQPIGTFYIAVINAFDLCDISYADIRMIGNQKGELDTYMGIQRKTIPSRIDEIKEYIKTSDACFPTGVLLHIEDECIEYHADRNEIIISATDDIEISEIAKILDGQHRMEGFKKIYDDITEREKLKNFEINISIFVGMDIAQQAIIFSTVNLAQTKVHKSLVYDLYEYSKVNSYEKICHNIAVALDTHKNSPFYKKIKRLGTATPGRQGETLTQATIVSSLLKYMAKDKTQLIQDRDKLMKGFKPNQAEEEDVKQFIFRNMAINGEEKKIADILYHYFSAVKERWPEAWKNQELGQILTRTNGFRALIKLLRDIYVDMGAIGDVPDKKDFSIYLSRSTLTDDNFNSTIYKPGGGGESSLYNDLREEILSNAT